MVFSRVVRLLDQGYRQEPLGAGIYRSSGTLRAGIELSTRRKRDSGLARCTRRGLGATSELTSGQAADQPSAVMAAIMMAAQSTQNPGSSLSLTGIAPRL